MYFEFLFDGLLFQFYKEYATNTPILNTRIQIRKPDNMGPNFFKFLLFMFNNLLSNNNLNTPQRNEMFKNKIQLFKSDC